MYSILEECSHKRKENLDVLIEKENLNNFQREISTLKNVNQKYFSEIKEWKIKYTQLEHSLKQFHNLEVSIMNLKRENERLINIIKDKDIELKNKDIQLTNRYNSTSNNFPSSQYEFKNKFRGKSPFRENYIQNIEF